MIGLELAFLIINHKWWWRSAGISGAGGGGCFVVYAPEKHTELTRFMEGHGLVRMHYQVEFEGSKIICNSSESSRNLDHSPTEEH